jgi:hypothetical protein
MDSRSLERDLNRVELRLGAIQHQIALGEWALYGGRSTKGPLKWQLEKNRLLSNPELDNLVSNGLRTCRSEKLHRRFELLERAALEAQVELHPEVARARAALQQKVSEFRPIWKGRRTGRSVLQHEYRSNPDRKVRKAAWYAEIEINRSIEPGLRALIELRNDRAREFGFRSYPELRLSFEGLTVASLERLLSEASRYVVDGVRSVRTRFRESTGVEGWGPWDCPYARDLESGLPDPAFPQRSMVNMVLSGLRGWGFHGPELEFRVDRHDLPAGGFEFPIDPPRDVRVIVHPQAGWVYIVILFHEMGHGVHDRSIRETSSLLRFIDVSPGSSSYVEGVGVLFEEIANEPGWLKGLKGITKEDLETFHDHRQERALERMGSLVGSTRTELSMYRRPRSDFSAERLRYEMRTFDFEEFDPPSYADPFYVFAPVYTHSYVLATLFAKQVLEAALRETGGPVWPNPEMGPWLVRNWFRHGGRYEWMARVKEVTGHPLSPKAFNRAMRPSAR